MMRSLLFFWLLKINVVLSLALFVIESRSRLRTMLRLAVSVLQAPISEFEMASLSIIRLFVRILLVVVGRIPLLMLMSCRHATTHPFQRVGNLTSVLLTAVVIRKTFSQTESIISIVKFAMIIRKFLPKHWHMLLHQQSMVLLGIQISVVIWHHITLSIERFL